MYASGTPASGEGGNGRCMKEGVSGDGGDDLASARGSR